MPARETPRDDDYRTERYCTCECLGAIEPDEHRDYCSLHPSQYDAEEGDE